MLNGESAFMLSRAVLIYLANRLYKPFARKPWLNGLPRACTFCFTALDPDNRFRYPPVSLFFDMCFTFWDGRGVWENLVGTERACAR